MSETQPSIVSRITELKQAEAALRAEAEVRRDDILAELAGLCGTLGPLTRAQIPEGIIRKREPRAKNVASKSPRKKGKPEAA